MKKRALILVVVILIITIIPVQAGSKERVGTRLDLFAPGGVIDFPAEEPFHIAHGFASFPPEGPKGDGHLLFKLIMNGNRVQPDFVEHLRNHELDRIEHAWVFNFPDGKTGTHTFRGEWYMPCKFAIEEGLYNGSCNKPNESVLTSYVDWEVNFTP
jgi:hypothetical protein